MDDTKINQLYTTYKSKIYNIALSYVKDPYLSEDISHEVLIKCYYNRDKFNGESSINTWVRTIVKNHCIDYLRGNHSKRISLYENRELEYLLNENITPEDLVFFQYEREILIEQVNTLPKIYEEVITLFYFNGYTLKEIRALLKVNISTIKTRLHRAKQILSKNYRIEELRR
ncbi:RNA polymerase sigma factor [Oceanobacillus salinisoli]|uniref:RNA polymerase sigma factor n=1 Tax=Oceanobacillus salinisoli TaxID=2678611 RepID=UPI0018CC6D24|nr:sigma-70 family RNA polymerase sigma factor [Oceanobacillus salinisoli]